jgi:hypothetical protein
MALNPQQMRQIIEKTFSKQLVPPNRALNLKPSLPAIKAPRQPPGGKPSLPQPPVVAPKYQT